MTAVFIRDRKGHKDTGKELCDDGGVDGSDMAPAPGSWELERQEGPRPGALRALPLAVPGLLASRAVRECISVVLTPMSVAICYGSLRKLIHTIMYFLKWQQPWGKFKIVAWLTS